MLLFSYISSAHGQKRMSRGASKAKVKAEMNLEAQKKDAESTQATQSNVANLYAQVYQQVSNLCLFKCLKDNRLNTPMEKYTLIITEKPDAASADADAATETPAEKE